MNAPYRYKLMPSAIQDLSEIASYVTEQLYAEESAIDLLNAIEDAIVAACGFPKSTPLVNDELLRSKGYRKLIVKNFIVLYTLDDEACILNVMRVVYFAKDYLKEL